MDFQSEIGRPSYNVANHLISVLNKHLQSLEKTVGWETNNGRNSFTKYSELFL